MGITSSVVKKGFDSTKMVITAPIDKGIYP